MFQKSAPSRIVVLSSIAHTRGQINTTDLNSDKEYDAGAAYNQSKLANILFTTELAKRLSGTGVTVNAVHPGIVDTDLFRHMGFFKSISGYGLANQFVWLGYQEWQIQCSFAFRYIFRPLFWPFVKTPFSGAQTVLYAALDPELENKSGLYFR